MFLASPTSSLSPPDRLASQGLAMARPDLPWNWQLQELKLIQYFSVLYRTVIRYSTVQNLHYWGLHPSTVALAPVQSPVQTQVQSPEQDPFYASIKSET
jgi:hypothetical protein